MSSAFNIWNTQLVTKIGVNDAVNSLISPVDDSREGFIFTHAGSHECSKHQQRKIEAIILTNALPVASFANKQCND